MKLCAVPNALLRAYWVFASLPAASAGAVWCGRHWGLGAEVSLVYLTDCEKKKLVVIEVDGRS